MDTRIEALLAEIRRLETQLREECKRKQHEFCYLIKDRKAHFQAETKAPHLRPSHLEWDSSPCCSSM